MFFCWKRPASKPSFLFSLYWASMFFFFGRLMHFFLGLFCSSNQHMLFILVLEIYMVRCKWIKKKKKKKVLFTCINLSLAVRSNPLYGPATADYKCNQKKKCWEKYILAPQTTTYSPDGPLNYQCLDSGPPI